MIKHSKSTLASATLLFGLSLVLSTGASANKLHKQSLKHRFTTFADVVRVEPVYRQVQVDRPQRECWIEHQEVVTYESHDRRPHYSNQRRNNAGDVIVGGIIGGVIGNQIGKHGGRHARRGATVAGAIIGSTIANEAHSNVRRHRNSRHTTSYRDPIRTVKTQPVERCKQAVHTEYRQKIKAYDVTYRFRGQNFTTRMTRDPGRQLELQVNIQPARQ